MTKVKGRIEEVLSGKVGGIVFVQMRGQTYVRSSPRKRNPKDWSEDQKAHRTRFSCLINFAKQFKGKVIFPIWNKAALGSNMSGYNLFVKTNNPAFDAQGLLADPGSLHFSQGALPLPYQLTAKLNTANPQLIDVSWKNQMAGTANDQDCLMAVFYSGDTFTDPINTGFKRRDEQVQIQLPPNSEPESYIYVFFHNEKQDSYSNDQFFTI
jgi:hypothetical protein